MDIVRLRILTKKSKAFFLNKSTQKTVGDFLKDDHYKILKAYYLNEKISFTDDILDFLSEKYTNFYRIEKPSKDLDFKEKIFQNIDWDSKTYEELKKIITIKSLNKQIINEELKYAFQRAKANRKMKKDNVNLNISKADLAGKNQGR